MAVVVDTNVAFVASGYAPQADAACINACVQRLHAITRTGGLLIDDLGLILEEYTKRLGYAGQPGAGEAFVKWAHSNQSTPEVVKKIRITRGAPGEWRLFREFPADPRLEKFDPDDQKFVAVAIASGEHPLILNAVDSDWWHHLPALRELDVNIEFVCPQHL